MDANVLKQVIELAKLMECPPSSTSCAQPGQKMRPVIVRSRDAGVQFGYLDRFEGSTVYLVDARQMWSWTAAEGGTLLDCATHGVKAGKFSGKASAVIVIGACAIIDCTDKAVATFGQCKWA